ncbi:uncharacterized protein LOC115838598 isoform X2 [Nomascus leucogenys]|uniref:uncharacterized protein LOC115838598 isoform X2 n=1 Tax=Nomascus leucogenys TaxID=61853 RepID=UPI00122D71A6|nr:uncharacterized protein LOC115838598 isoform X2 [Nomascus leucogenys]
MARDPKAGPAWPGQKKQCGTGVFWALPRHRKDLKLLLQGPQSFPPRSGPSCLFACSPTPPDTGAMGCLVCGTMNTRGSPCSSTTCLSRSGGPTWAWVSGVASVPNGPPGTATSPLGRKSVNGGHSDTCIAREELGGHTSCQGRPQSSAWAPTLVPLPAVPTEELHDIQGELQQIKAQVDSLLQSLECMDQQQVPPAGGEPRRRPGQPGSSRNPSRLISSRHSGIDGSLSGVVGFEGHLSTHAN